jgi:hypothetical protein
MHRGLGGGPLSLIKSARVSSVTPARVSQHHSGAIKSSPTPRQNVTFCRALGLERAGPTFLDVLQVAFSAPIIAAWFWRAQQTHGGPVAKFRIAEVIGAGHKNLAEVVGDAPRPCLKHLDPKIFVAELADFPEGFDFLGANIADNAPELRDRRRVGDLGGFHRGRILRPTIAPRQPCVCAGF